MFSIKLNFVLQARQASSKLYPNIGFNSEKHCVVHVKDLSILSAEEALFGIKVVLLLSFQQSFIV